MTAQRKPSPPVVKLSPQTHAKLLALSREDDRPMGEIVTYLIDRFERERFWMKVRDDLARVKQDPIAWQGYLDEVEAWDDLAESGLEDEEPYYTPEEEREILAKAEARRAQGG